jgi:hypothetical protein
MLVLLSWCPGKNPPDKCDLCACKWIDPPKQNYQGTQRSYVDYLPISLSRIIGCSPKFGVEFWQDQSQYGGSPLAWFGPVISPDNPFAGASATLSHGYYVKMSDGTYQNIVLNTATGSTVKVMDPNAIPLQWATTKLYFVNPDGTGYFVYSQWSGAPTGFVLSRPGGDMYGYLYDGPLTSDDQQVFSVTANCIGGILEGSASVDFHASGSQ